MIGVQPVGSVASDPEPASFPESLNVGRTLLSLPLLPVSLARFSAWLLTAIVSQ